jgi:hypothetical protein
MGKSDTSAKVLCAISHGLYEPWLSILREGQQPTWLSIKFPENFKVLHYHGTPVRPFVQHMDRLHEKIRWKNRYVASLLCFFDNLVLAPLLYFIPKNQQSKMLPSVGKVIHIKFPDTYLTYRWKFLSLLNYFVYETNSDFLFVTSTASYVQPDQVIKFVNRIPDTSTYAGAEPYEGAGFISGSNRIISREIALQVLQTRRRWKPGVIEDIEFTRLIVANGNKLMTFPIVNIDSISKLSKTPDALIKNNYHFRLKSLEGTNRNDISIMKLLHQRVLQLQNGEQIEHKSNYDSI